MAATGEELEQTLPLLGNGDVIEVALGALAAATAVTLGRIALLQVWEEFAVSTDRSNAQVLGALEGADAMAQVAVGKPGARGGSFVSRRFASGDRWDSRRPCRRSFSVRCT